MKKIILATIFAIIAKPTLAIQVEPINIDDTFKGQMCKVALSKVNWNQVSDYNVLNIIDNTITLKSSSGYTYQCVYSGDNIFDLKSTGWQRIMPHIKYTPSSSPDCFDLNIYDPAIQDSYNETVCK